MAELEAYRQAAIAHGDASLAGNAKLANHAYDELAHIRRTLRRDGHADRILTLLDDKSIYVRLWAAVDALELSPDAGVRVLRELANGPICPARGSAESLLEQWEAGTFVMPW